MRLLVISHTPHYIEHGRVVGWGPTIRELDHLATRFDEVRHIAFLYREAAPRSALAYASPRIELVPVPPAGSPGVLGKLDVLRTSPIYIRTITRELRNADFVHVRAPANIALLAMLVLQVRQHPAGRWFKYAGNWMPEGRESPSYTLQRTLLARGHHRGIVTINGSWPGQPNWVRTFYNPSLDDTEIEQGRLAAGTKALTWPVQILFVGALSASKGAGRALEVLAEVRTRGVDAELDVVGDGPERLGLERLARELGVLQKARFHGWLQPVEVHERYRTAHLMLLPSLTEGWPKVLSEGMAYGVVPLAGSVSSITQYLRQFGAGVALPPHDVRAFADEVVRYASDPARWSLESRRAVEAARRFTFSHYLGAVDGLLAEVGSSRSNTSGRSRA